MANPKDTKAAALVQTVFRGETLRGLLLNAWGWWTICASARWAAIVVAIGAVVTLGTLVFVAPERAARPIAAGVRVTASA
jgi:hypothetical protein